MDSASSRLKRRRSVISTQFKALHLWWCGGCISAYGSLHVWKGIMRATYAPIHMTSSGLACFSKAMLSCMLHLLQQQGFVVDESQNIWNIWNIMKQRKPERRRLECFWKTCCCGILFLKMVQFDIYQSVNDYKAISKALWFQQTTVRAIIHYWNIPREVSLSKLIQEHINDSSRRPQKNQETSKELQNSLMCSWFNNKKGNGQRNERHCWPKRPQRLISHLPKDILVIPETSGKIFIGLTRQKVNFLESLSFHYNNRISYKEQESDTVVVWW